MATTILVSLRLDGSEPMVLVKHYHQMLVEDRMRYDLLTVWYYGADSGNNGLPGYADLPRNWTVGQTCQR